jgi:hypothetical protein
MRSEPQRAWVDVYVEAQHEAEAGRYDRADSLLAGYMRRHASAAEANEARYWRAFFLLDPANPQTAPREAAKMLGQYLDAGVTQVHATEAATLRRTARALDSLSGSVQAAQAALVAAEARAGDANKEKAPAAAAASPDEVQKLRDELARTQAELERIKKRLATPTRP